MKYLNNNKYTLLVALLLTIITSPFLIGSNGLSETMAFGFPTHYSLLYNPKELFILQLFITIFFVNTLKTFFIQYGLVVGSKSKNKSKSKKRIAHWVVFFVKTVLLIFFYVFVVSILNFTLSFFFSTINS